MTSPAISGQKENSSATGGKDASSNDESASTAGKHQEAALAGEEPTPALTAWWRVFKLASLLMKQGC